MVKKTEKSEKKLDNQSPRWRAADRPSSIFTKIDEKRVIVT